MAAPEYAFTETDTTTLQSDGWREIEGGPIEAPERPDGAQWAEVVCRLSVESAFTDEGVRAISSAEIKAWLDSHGAERVRAFAVVRSPDGRYSLHVSELRPDPRNAEWTWFDVAADRVVALPRVIDLGNEPTWPEGMNAEVFRPKTSTFIFTAENEPTPKAEG